MSRITRNHASTNLLAENRDVSGLGRKHAGMAAKRKATDEPHNPKTKRSALGEINVNNTNMTAGDTLKKQMKKGLTNIVAKGKEGLKVRDTKASMLRQSFRKKNGKCATDKEEKGIKEDNEENSDVIPESVVEVKMATQSEDAPALTVSTSSEEGVSDSKLNSTVRSTTSTEGEESEYIIISPPRKTPPEGVVDFDLETKGDPSQHSEYAMQTFQYYKDRESVFKVPNYIHAQNEITELMRAILVDWLVEVQESFELNHETLYTAVKLTDLYLAKKQVKKEDLQLVGATACLIASKVDERIPPMVDDFLYVCDDAYSRDQIMRMERKMLAVVGFDLGFSLSYRFLRRYGRVCKVTMPVLTLARYILESSLLEYNMNVELSESLLAASCLVLAFKIKGIEGWEATLLYYSGYNSDLLIDTVRELLTMLKKPAKENLKTVRSKYSHKVFHEVATLPLPEQV